MEFLPHTVSNMSIQKFHSPYSIRNNNIPKHYVPLFPFTHPAHNEKERRLREIVSPGNRLLFSVINRIGKEQKCADLQNGYRSAKICREMPHDRHLPYSFLIYGRDTDAVIHKSTGQRTNSFNQRLLKTILLQYLPVFREPQLLCVQFRHRSEI